MDPTIKSALTTLIVAVLGVGIGWAVKQGFIAQSDAATIANAGATIVLAVGAVAMGWLKTRNHTPAAIVQAAVLTQPAATARAMVEIQPDATVQAVVAAQPAATIQAINAAPNGVKVVDQAAPAQAVDKPLQGPGS